ncbi:TRAP transporter permease [Mesobacterium sp. TK19101]|uniref:TRAP transporter permease n=1 Tax=Mesobacterium hydrothermale TaxID=3111907 RepID=A0ABU6HMA1_9RHOB|nr:TRAP transporter permease [Mesobacterium sp. TK19101]MEC3863034.1 TRAP transporter permease [Mesobacterium sp. TK19101]
MTSDTRKGPQGVAEAEAFAADLDVGARNPTGWQGKLIALVALVWAFAQVFNASPLPAILAQATGQSWIYINSDVERVLHLTFGLTLATLAFPAFKQSARDHIPWYDWLLIAAGLYATLYLLVFQTAIADRPGLWTTGDVVASAVGLAVVLVATYRALGLPMVLVAFFFLMYVFFGDRDFFPDAMQWKGASFSKAMGHFWMQTEGVFGLALGVSASMVFLFVLFGSLLEKAGAGNYFIKLAFALMGHLKGGPAKAAVVASAATGLISGSSIANTVTTGTFTIPLMKRVGFPAEKAGAVEVASSTNGQLTPPVMGAAAFLMVEYVGISYLEVVKHAFLPAIISYIALVYIVHLEAEKMGLEGLPRQGIKRSAVQRLTGLVLGLAIFCGLSLAIYYGLGWLKPLLGDWSLPGMALLFFAAYMVLLNWSAKFPDLEIDDPDAPFTALPEPGPTAKTGYYYVLPVVVLIWNLMIERLSPGLSAFWATLSMIFIMLTQHPLKAMLRGQGMTDWGRGWSEFLDGMIAGSRNMIGISVATGTAGIIVGTVSLTGAHQVIGEFIEVISGGSLLLMLIFVALFSLVLGMGLPTTATYIVITSLMAPVIVAVGAKSGLIVPLIAVHMFVFYFGILADDTPPVGLAAFAAAAISKGDPIKTGIIGFSYDVRTAILPFLFIFNTELLLIDVTPLKAVFVFIVAVVAMMLFAAATQNWFLAKSRLWESAALLLIAFTLFRPGFWLNMVEPEFTERPGAAAYAVAAEMPDGADLRIRIAGPDFDGGHTSSTVMLNLGGAGDGESRFMNAGLMTLEEDDKTVVDGVTWDSKLTDLQTQFAFGDFDDPVVVDAVLIENDRMPKEVFYIPALALLALIAWLQLGRARRQTAAV